MSKYLVPRAAALVLSLAVIAGINSAEAKSSSDFRKLRNITSELFLKFSLITLDVLSVES